MRWNDEQYLAWHRAEVMSGRWPSGASNRPAKPVRMDVVLRWVRMKYPDGMSFSPMKEGFGWVPKVEKRKRSKGDEVIRLHERVKRRADRTSA